MLQFTNDFLTDFNLYFAFQMLSFSKLCKVPYPLLEALALEFSGAF